MPWVTPPASEAVKVHVKGRVWSGYCDLPGAMGETHAQVNRLNIATEVIRETCMIG